MNADERIARDYLDHQGLGPCTYEPYGNRPPDFLLPNGAHVEVRRLNQTFHGPDKSEGLERVENTAWGAVERAVRTFETAPSAQSYVVWPTLERPVGTGGRSLAKRVRAVLQDVIDTQPAAPVTTAVHDRVSLSITPTARPLPVPFLFFGLSDENTAGDAADLYADNSQHCIEEKVHKVVPYMSDGADWWLLLVDTIGLAPLAHEVTEIDDRIDDLGPFIRVIVVDPTRGDAILDLPTNT